MKKLILIFACVTVLVPITRAQENGGDGEFKVRQQTTKEEKKKKEKEDSDEKAFKQGSFAITVGYGFPNLYKSLYKSFIVNWNNFIDPYGTYTYAYSTNAIGPAFLKLDYGVTKLIGLGLTAGYFNANINETRTYEDYNSVTGLYQEYQDKTKYAYSSLSIGARINFHFGTGEKLDPYVGGAVGYSYNTVNQTYSSDNPNYVLPAPYTRTGVPYHFAMTIGMRYYFTPNIGIYGEVGFDKWSLIQGGLAIKF